MINPEDKQQETLRAAIYLRVSTDEQAENGYGLDMQKRACLARIESAGVLLNGKPKMVFSGDPNNLSDPYFYIDDGFSGTLKPNERPGLARLYEDLTAFAKNEDKPFDIIVVYKIDRFARKLKYLLNVVDFFEENNVNFISANESIDTSTPFGRAILGIIGVIAELEIETTKLRTQDGRRSAIDKGRPMGSNIPFGYTTNSEKLLAVFETEAQYVQEIFDMFVIENKTYNEIANSLTDRGVFTPDASAMKHGKRKGISKRKNSPTLWLGSKIKKILTNELYIGKYYFGKTETIINKKTGKKKQVAKPKEDWGTSKYNVPPIINHATFMTAQKKMGERVKKDNLKKRAQNNQHIYLLSGLLRCQHCCEKHSLNYQDAPTWQGEPHTLNKGQANEITTYIYKCMRRQASKFDKSRRCHTLPLPADQIEDIVISAVKRLLEDPRPVAEYNRNLESRKKKQAILINREKQIIESISGIPQIKEQYSEQQAEKIISMNKLKAMIDKQDERLKKLEAELIDIQEQIATGVMDENYVKTFNYCKENYQSILNDNTKDRAKIYKLLNSLISRIDVYSRPVTPNDKISGSKKKDDTAQMIPQDMAIRFRLPNELIKELFIQFGVNNFNR